MPRTVVAFVAVLAALALTACAPAPPPEPPDRSAEAEAAVRAAVEAWAATAAAKDAEAFASYYADDAVVLFEGAPDLRGMEAIRGALAGMMGDPAFALSFAPDRVVAASSGDLAYEAGPYTMSFTGPDGAPMTQVGYYVAVWRKQADGSWKCVLDAPVSDPPPEAAPAS